MRDPAASVLARLKHESAKAGRTYHLSLQLFCQEEFLRRLQHSRHVTAFTLKGGFLIYSLSEFSGRPTMDVDFLAQDIPSRPYVLESIVAEIIAVAPSTPFITFRISGTSPISEATDYPGLSVSLVAQIKNVRIPFKLDIAFGDALHGEKRELAIPIQLNGFTPPVVQAYPLESVVAEKFDVMLALLDFSSRMKDYYDIWFLSMQFDFDGEQLRGAFCATFEQRERKISEQTWEDFSNLLHSVSMSDKWSVFVKKLGLQAPPFQSAMQEILLFLRRPFYATVTSKPFPSKWCSRDRKWHSKPWTKPESKP